MSGMADVEQPITIGRNGITIGGQVVPGVLADEVTVQADREIPGFWRVTATFLTSTYPTSDFGTVDEPVDTRVIRPARQGDLD
ncbi:hypothetical protein [Prescottella equi]|uniref:Uncharacterized protein n=2 Tax=Rhodococcus hoagii TaxID=43767 RepID=A0A9Q2PQC3_RHOHA|nr:hypothetical protein [Prescottella equi]MBM4489451.1 hypothetical protein [Prescottella equi]MBM4489522.1 hypothetical protein [Prescottella equi]MBM4567968.1 hypothetical protein [Prescottella equi]MBM4590188.1 hypothetical protein [Prescottella equi]NKS54736.1 hypothetical protein [Prescottella equi]